VTRTNPLLLPGGKAPESCPHQETNDVALAVAESVFVMLPAAAAAAVWLQSTNNLLECGELALSASVDAIPNLAPLK
jgi:hypothetical protein